MALLHPKTIDVPTAAGGVKQFVISKLPAIPAREIMAKYPVANIPKIGDYDISKDVMLKLMGFVGVELAPGNIVMLVTEDLINNHCEDWETLARVEFKMLEYNCSFFGNGVSSNFFEGIAPKLQAWISKISTDFLPQLLQMVKQASETSPTNTH